MSAKLTEITLCRRALKPELKSQAVDFFLSLGFEAHEITSTDLKALFKFSVYTSSAKPVRAAELAFRKQAPAGWSLRIKKLGEDDWLHKWKRHFRITPFGKKFAVVPLWQKGNYKGRRRPILIDPESAFGSGTHETTRLMIQLMEPLEGRFESFFDAGAGTGVLSAAASFLGAKKIQGTDLDPGSVKTSRLNMRLNRVRGAVMKRSDLTRDRIPGEFDLVAANLISKTLVECQEILGRGVKGGGHLLVSGISLKNFPGFLKEFRPKGFVRTIAFRGKSWAAALFHKTQENAGKVRSRKRKHRSVK